MDDPARAYRLEQTETDVTVTVSVPEGARGKYFDVQFTRTVLRVSMKGEVVLEGGLYRDVKADECSWSLDSDGEGKKVLVIHLEKAPGGYGTSRFWTRLLAAGGEESEASSESESESEEGDAAGPAAGDTRSSVGSDGLFAALDGGGGDGTESTSSTPSSSAREASPPSPTVARHVDPTAAAPPESPPRLRPLPCHGKKRWAVFERAVCYATLRPPAGLTAEAAVADGFVRCEGCGVAWYSSAAAMEQHRPVHAKACRMPDFARIDAMCTEDVWEELRECLRRHVPAADLPALLTSLLYRLLRDDLEGVDPEEVAHTLHVATRVDAKARAGPPAASDPLHAYYSVMWALPGMPQVLLFTDLLCCGYRRVRQLYPSGLLWVPLVGMADKMDDTVLQNRPEWGESETEPLAAWHLGFLVRSAVRGAVAKADYLAGAGPLREAPLGAAAVRRVFDLLRRNDVLHSCGFGALTVPHFVAHLARTAPPVFVEHFHAGVVAAVLLWVGGLCDGGVQPALDVLKAVRDNMAALPFDARYATLAVLAVCWNDAAERRPWGFPGTAEEDRAALDHEAGALVAALLRSCTPAAVGARLREKRIPPGVAGYHCTEREGYEALAVLAFLVRRAAEAAVLDAAQVAAWLREWGAAANPTRSEYYTPGIMPAQLAVELKRRCRAAPVS